MSANLRPRIAGICVVLLVSAVSGRTFVAAGAPQSPYPALDVALGANTLDEARRLIPEDWTAAERLFVSYLERAYLPEHLERPDAEARTRAGRLAEVFFRIQEYDFAQAVVGALDIADPVKRQALVSTTRDFFRLLQRSREARRQSSPGTDFEGLTTEIYGLADRFRSLGLVRGELFALLTLTHMTSTPRPDGRTVAVVAAELGDALSLQVAPPYTEQTVAVAQQLHLPRRQVLMLESMADKLVASREPGNVARAAQYLERAAELVRSLPPIESVELWYAPGTDLAPWAAWQTLPNLWMAYQLLNRDADAQILVTEAVDISRPFGVAAEVRTITAFASRAAGIGDADRATALYERAVTLAERSEHWPLVMSAARGAAGKGAVPLAVRLDFATRAISAAERAGSLRDLAEALVTRSQIGKGATARSYDDLQQAVAAAERYTAESGFVSQELYCLRFLAIEHQMRGEYHQAVEVWRRRVQRAGALDPGNQDVKRESYEMLVDVYMNKLGEPALARDASERLLQTFHNTTAPEEFMYFTMARVSRMLGRPADALEYYDNALRQSTVQRRRSRGFYPGAISEARAQVSEEYGDYEVALRDLADAASQGRQVSAAQARLYALAGDPDRALAHARDAVAKRQKSPAGSWMRPTELNTVTRILDLTGHPDEAVAFVEMSRDVWLEGESDTPVARRVYLEALANAYVGAGRFDDARVLLLTAVDIDRKEPTAETGGLGASLLALGRLEAAADNPAKAVEHLNAAREAIDAFDLDRSWQIERALARSLARTGSPEAADSHYQNALAALEGLRVRIRPEEFRFRYGEDRDAIYGEHAQLLAELAIASGEPREAVRAFQASERKRTEMLWSLLATGWSRLDPDGWPDQLRRLQEMDSRINAKRALLAGQGLLPAEKREAALIDSLEKELKSLQEGHARLLSSVAQGRYRYAAPAQLSSSLAAPVQAALGPSRVLVEYLVTHDHSYAFVVSAGGIEVVRLPIGRAAMRQQVQQLLAPFHQARTGEVDLTRLGFDTSAAHTLYQAIFTPVRPHLGTTTNLVVVPDDVLNLLPFEALVEKTPGSTPGDRVLHGQFADVSFLVRRYDISYLNSSAQLLAAKTDEAPAAPKRLFAMANPTGWVAPPTGDDGPDRRLRAGSVDPYLVPLPGAEAEVRRIASFFARDAATLVVGTGATEAAYREQAGSADVVHFATHAVASDGQPLYTTLVLAPDADASEDGFLQAYEVLQTPLRAELVVLSACETALGAEDWGQGRVGLVTAFEQAGARSVLATLWSVEEPTADLMAAFYRAMAEGNSTSAALRQAKLHLMQQRVRIGKTGVSLAHPFFWAPFILVGDPAHPPAVR